MDNYYNQIKEQIINNEITKQVKNCSINKSELTTYYNIGKILNDAGRHYGEGIIKNYSTKLSNEFGKKYNTTLLKRIRQFYLIIQKGATLWHQLSWSHYRILITINNIEEINYYIDISVKQNLSVRELEKRIKSNEYEILSREYLLTK